MNDSADEIAKKFKDEIQQELQEEEFKEVIALIKRQNEKHFFCFKKKIKKDVRERVKETITKYGSVFEARLKLEELDVTRILKVGENKEVDEYGRVY